MLARLSDPAVPGADKIGLVELATADDAAALDKFGRALADNGALPLTFDAVDLKWSETEAGNVVATVNVTTANKPPGKFSFPMEFTPVRDRWQLTRKTADLLLDFGARADRHDASSLTMAICGSAGSSSTCCSGTCIRSNRSARRCAR